MTTGTVSRPPEPQRPAQATSQGHGKAPGEKPAESDLFASLLSLVSDTHLAPDAAAAAPPAEPPATDTTAQDAPEQNPLAALLAWATPAMPATPATSAATDSAAPRTAEPVLSLTEKPQAGGVDITGMTPVVDESATSLATATHPANAPARPAFATPAARPAWTGRTGEAPAQGGAPAMVWQRGAVSSTDVLHQQHSAQMAQLAPVRSTVALDERFSLPGTAATAAPALRGEAASSIDTPTTTGGPARPVMDTAPGVTGGASAGDAAAGEHAGDTPGDALPGEPAGRGEASAEAEGPTVSHWGTQHLRHASLRVGESGADAIDIQLSMKGQEVQVAFQSDNAEARASLREGASEALSELLQRSGIQLGNVSVGAQGQQNGGAAQHTPTVSRGESVGRDTAPAEAAIPAQPRPRADGSRPLDLFV